MTPVCGSLSRARARSARVAWTSCAADAIAGCVAGSRNAFTAWRGTAHRRDFQPAVLAGLRRYVKTLDEDARTGAKRGASLWLSGPIGTGKSTAAALVALEAGKRGYDVSWWGMSKLLSRIKATFAADSDDHAYHLREEIGRYDLLVLDDVGTIRAGAWTGEELYLIVNERYENDRPIIVTADVDLDGMREAIGKRTVSRLIEMAGKPVEFRGPDHRERAVYGAPPAADSALTR